MVLVVGRVMFPLASGLSRIETDEDVHWMNGLAREPAPIPGADIC